MQSIFFLRRDGPDALQGQLGFNVIVEFVVLGKQLFEQFLLSPEADTKETGGKFFLYVGLGAALAGSLSNRCIESARQRVCI